MIMGKQARVSIWILIVTAVIFWTIGTGFSRDLSSRSEETYPSLKVFADVLDLVERTYVEPVDTKELIESAIRGMIQSLDPHSAFLTPDDFKELQVDTQGEFTGIGIQITMRDGLVTVISPIEGTPAYKAGIIAGDKIVEVDDESIKDLYDAVKKMRGPRGTEVKVTILRKGEREPIDFLLIRDKIPIKSIRYSLLKPDYGFIRITNFSINTTETLTEALMDLESGDVPLKGLVLDLRDNPGGLLDQAVAVSDLFLDKGNIVSIKGRQKRNTKEFNAHPGKTARNYPIIILINGGSASASEIVAGALQDNKRALIIGTTSFGKGSVQSVETLRGGSGLKLTIARYYTPSGRSIQAQGIEPDIVVEREYKQESETKKRRHVFLKEKDLENHLDVESLKDMKEKPKAQETDKEDIRDNSEMPEMESWVGPIDQEKLLSDNQISRALEILIGYEKLYQIHG